MPKEKVKTSGDAAPQSEELSLQDVYKRLDDMARRLETIEGSIKKWKEQRRKKKEKEAKGEAGHHDAEVAQGGKTSKKRKLSPDPGKQKRKSKRNEPTAQDKEAAEKLEMIANSRTRPKKQTKPVAEIKKEKPDESDFKSETISDPKGTYRCYEILNVPRTADPNMLKKAFRVRALALHPDKPTGNHKMFLALHEAFELMQDATQRAIYDSELVRAGSRDGLSYTDSDSMQANLKVVADPCIFVDALLAFDDTKWPALFSVLTNEHLVKMVKYLQNSYVPEPNDEQDSAPVVPGKMSTPGIHRSGPNYFARIFIEGTYTVETYKVPDLSAAIDARIALLRLRTRVSDLKKGSNCPIDDAMRLGAQELRSAEQHAAFWLHFSYKYQVGKTGRYLQTPFLQDLDVVIFDKQKAMDLNSAGASPEEIQAAHDGMRMRERALRMELRTKRDQRLKKMLEAAEHHATIRSALDADRLAIGNEPEKDEKGDEQDEKADVSDMEDEQTLSSLVPPKKAKAKAKPSAKKKDSTKNAEKKQSSSSSDSSSSDSDSSSSS